MRQTAWERGTMPQRLRNVRAPSAYIPRHPLPNRDVSGHRLSTWPNYYCFNKGFLVASTRSQHKAALGSGGRAILSVEVTEQSYGSTAGQPWNPVLEESPGIRTTLSLTIATCSLSSFISLQFGFVHLLGEPALLPSLWKPTSL